MNNFSFDFISLFGAIMGSIAAWFSFKTYKLSVLDRKQNQPAVALAVMSRPEYQAASEEEKKQMILDACEYAGRHEDEINHIQLWRDLITPLIPEAVLQDSDFGQ